MNPPGFSGEGPDPFRSAREESPTLPLEVAGENIPMLLRLQDIRAACKNTAVFSSARPFHITLEPETAVRNFRQFPIESDPPEHTDYRAIVEPMFRRADQPEYVAEIRKILEDSLDRLLERGEAEIVREFALPVQCRALTLLLGLPEQESAKWIEWGTHVFHDSGGGGSQVEAYIAGQLERASRAPGDDFFSALHRASFQGRPLTYDEKQGFANLAFAGGRDTIIQTLTGIFAVAADQPGLLQSIREQPELAVTATEEIVRFVSPLTVLARSCTRDTPYQTAGGRVGLCWSSANRDARFFPDPDTFDAGRSPNPHIGFGFGPHNCLGATHARTLLRTLFLILAERNVAVRLVRSQPTLETYGSHIRQSGMQELRVSLSAAKPAAQPAQRKSI